MNAVGQMGRALGSGLLLLALGGLLAGCGGGQSSVEEAVERGIEEQTDSQVEVETAALPDDWPSEVPVVDEEILSSSSWETDGHTTWTVMLSVVDPAAAFADAKARLTAAGFSLDGEGESGTSTLATLRSSEYTVDLIADEGGGSPTLSYIVSPA